LEDAIDYAISGGLVFKQKLSAMRKQGVAAFALLGGQGDMPSAS